LGGGLHFGECSCRDAFVMLKLNRDVRRGDLFRANREAPGSRARLFVIAIIAMIAIRAVLPTNLDGIFMDAVRPISSAAGSLASSGE